MDSHKQRLCRIVASPTSEVCVLVLKFPQTPRIRHFMGACVPDAEEKSIELNIRSWPALIIPNYMIKLSVA